MQRVFSVSAGLLALAMVVTSASAMEPPQVGEAAPAFTLKDIDGNRHSLKDFRGQVVVMHFQQIGCPWEKNYQPYFNKLAKKYGQKNTKVQFLAINSNKTDSIAKLKKTKKNRPVAYPVLKDPGNKVADKYAAKVTPHIYIIDKEGTLRYKGGVEKNPASPGQVTESKTQFLEPALNAVLEGSEVPHKSTQPKGCGIKRE